MEKKFSQEILLGHMCNNNASLLHKQLCKTAPLDNLRRNWRKTCFYSVRGSYNVRIAAAVIKHDTQQVFTELNTNVNNYVPSIVENLEDDKKQIKLENLAKIELKNLAK